MNPHIISPDLFLLNDDAKYEWSTERVAEAWDKAFDALRDALADVEYLWMTIGVPGSGKSFWLSTQRMTPAGPALDPAVVFDATLCSRTARRPILELARLHGVKVEGLVFDVPLLAALERNSSRPPARRVPYGTLVRMFEQLEAEPPTLAEGFWRLTRALEFDPQMRRA